jgi:hypothetical protein
MADMKKEHWMEIFEYKVLWYKQAGLFAVHWFDGDQDLGPEITTELLAPYGQDGWEVVTAMQTGEGWAHKIILKRRQSSPQKESTNVSFTNKK